MALIFPAPPAVTIPVEGRGDLPVRRIFCVGRNYAAHATEMGADPSREPPFFFAKSAHAVWPSGRDLPYPPGTRDLQHEVELAVALGPDAVPFAAGVALDMTRRDLQAGAKERRQPWEVGKEFDGAAIFAPMRVIDDFGGRRIRLSVDGEIRQDGSTDDMIWPVAALLDHLRALYALAPGDVVLTGTPAGVGPVVPGERLAGRIDGLPDLDVTVAPPL